MAPTYLYPAWISSTLNVFQLTINLISLPLVVILLYVLVRDRTYTGSFFSIYKIGLTYDLISLIVIPIIGSLATRGHLLPESFMETQLYLIIYNFFNYAMHFCQSITNTLICINRAAAVLVPKSYDKLWNTRFLLPCCFIGQFGAGCLAGASSLRFEMYLLKYDSGGGRFPMVVVSPEIQRFFTQIFVKDVVLCLNMIGIYSVVVWKFRSTMTGGTPGGSLLCIAVVVVAWEAIVCIFYWNLFVGELDFDRDFRMQYVVYYCLVTFYSGVPTYLLLVFYKPIRLHAIEAVLNIFEIQRKSSTTSVGSDAKVARARSPLIDDLSMYEDSICIILLNCMENLILNYWLDR
ncbi:hypothetical protein PRIPAC_77404 [Pristionchus pacificus]|uniref:G protein-coupled receptor n=1 Tax=Pristionchus pacificus TaxID=54126 RepID=A0A2A6CJK1_PRIPA|nr:hypothetical protein PRIPAC_77404 [Pristionchus pacificus]|eukprot:PDM78223.1 G protein-coupled receptor [Pristionchus pacificus]